MRSLFALVMVITLLGFQIACTTPDQARKESIPKPGDRSGAFANSDKNLSGRIETRSFQSHALEMEVPFTVIVPSGQPPQEGWPSLYLLHGRGRSHLSLVEEPQSRQLLLEQPYLIVLPNGFDGWYVNSPVNPKAKYSDALQELESIIDRDYPLENTRKSRAIIGWSMGGYGALYQATRRPERYTFAGAIIGLLDFPNDTGLPEGQRYQVPEGTFGSDPDIWPSFNPRIHINNLKNIRVFLVIGENAFDRTMNENFLREARQASINIHAVRLPHAHTFQAVQEGLPIILNQVRKYFQ